ncbi:family 2 glycosyl transferase [Candidatus Protofrankia californiensis]|uniref:Family 2 glycosyl transferase n=1 Tax=Candidatus Protofrankia californiensis TaxID=1839754 RepID=A0A1C3NXQ9_9ACTN|nr:family 2 glycosyl transferase [Candidatus Protofrankia californiensis]
MIGLPYAACTRPRHNNPFGPGLVLQPDVRNSGEHIMIRTFTPAQPLSPYGSTDEPAPLARSVPVTAIILARDECRDIARAVRSVGWCRQIVVVDSGSTDGTPQIARAHGATVWEERWRGFAGQREWAMRNPDIQHDWVYFLDADEWVSNELAAEIAARVGRENCVAYTHRRRFVFLGRWIAHCGWYNNSWQARLLNRRFTSFAATEQFSERASVNGAMFTLMHDLVDEDSKGLTCWLHKHITYAELEARRRDGIAAPLHQLQRVLTENRDKNTRPLTRTIARDVIFPLIPFKALTLFFYMYILQSGWRDGWQGLVFCLHRAWYEKVISLLSRPESAPGGSRRNPAPDSVDVPRQIACTEAINVDNNIGIPEYSS